MKRLCTFILALLFTISLSAQQMAKGIVYDDSGIPVGGVLVSVDGDNSTIYSHRFERILRNFREQRDCPEFFMFGAST